MSRAELQNLLGEREHLATRMKRDAAAIESRIARARQDGKAGAGASRRDQEDMI